MRQKKNYIEAFMKFIASKRFFYVVIGLFLFQATWIGLSNNYGSPHDEKYHVGVIQVYSQQASPFMGGQPTAYDQFGDVSRNSSYLYHYLMSFPYRLISSISNDITVQVLFLRLFNIIFVAMGLLFFKKVLDSIFGKPIISNLTLYGVVMIPVVTYVASGVNYDNLVFLGFAAALYLTTRLINKFSLEMAIIWISINILTILVKFSYSPIAFVLFVGVIAYYSINRKKRSSEIKESLRNTKKIKIILAILLLIIAGGLFAERYIGNAIAYGTPLPDCSRVLGNERCSKWGPWARNIQVQQENSGEKRANIIIYAKNWVKTMESTSFGIYKTSVVKEALPIIGFVGWALLATFLIFLAFGARYIIKRPIILIALVPVVIYSVILFFINYKEYQKLGSPIAIQGRYLILTLPLLIGSTLFFIHKLFANRKIILKAFVLLWLVAFLQGGVITYIASSDKAWWWHDNTVITVNKSTQNLLKTVIIGN
ncbi:MAG: hypothetical protein WA087_04255 [Candidatus Saccharimonadales bacterium]